MKLFNAEGVVAPQAGSAPLVAAAAGADGSGELRKRKGAAAVARSARGSSELRKPTHGSF